MAKSQLVKQARLRLAKKYAETYNADIKRIYDSPPVYAVFYKGQHLASSCDPLRALRKAIETKFRKASEEMSYRCATANCTYRRLDPFPHKPIWVWWNHRCCHPKAGKHANCEYIKSGRCPFNARSES